MSITDLTSSQFIAGYKHQPEQEDIYWLGNHPESIDLIFSKDKNKAFIFDNAQTAFDAIQEILIAENHSWYTPIVENFQPEVISPAPENKGVSFEQTEAKINEFLKLFNERSNSRLKLYLTFNEKEQTIRGYGSGFKLGDAVMNFVALLTIKGMKARCLDQHTFVIKID